MPFTFLNRRRTQEYSNYQIVQCDDSAFRIFTRLYPVPDICAFSAWEKAGPDLTHSQVLSLRKKLNRLGEVLTWLYGSQEEGVPSVIRSQNPDVRRLGAVLDSPEALSIMRASRSLEEAHTSTYPANQRFSESLIRARREVREASNNLRGL